MAYRDEREKCPRCQVDLVDAGSVRACPQCTGQWVSLPVLMEMANAMAVYPAPRRLELSPDKHETLACPTCGNGMQTYKLYAVPIDRCEPHGIWFDRDELMAVLLASFRFE